MRTDRHIDFNIDSDLDVEFSNHRLYIGFNDASNPILFGGKCEIHAQLGGSGSHSNSITSVYCHSALD